MTQPAAIVLDFDGVVANSEPLHLRAFQQVLSEQGVTLGASEYYARYLGFDDLGVVCAIAADRRLDWSARQVRDLIERKAALLPDLLRDPGVLLPGVADRMREYAAVVPLAIASGARREEIELVLDATGLAPHVTLVVAAGETPQGKPAPDPYVRAIDDLRARGLVGDRAHGRSVAVEDSHWGIASAKAAGLYCVAVTTSYPAAELGDADLVVAGLHELPLGRLGALVEEGSRA